MNSASRHHDVCAHIGSVKDRLTRLMRLSHFPVWRFIPVARTLIQNFAPDRVRILHRSEKRKGIRLTRHRGTFRRVTFMSVQLEIAAGIITSLKCKRTSAHQTQLPCVSGAAQAFHLKEMKLNKSQSVNTNNKRATKPARMFGGDCGPWSPSLISMQHDDKCRYLLSRTILVSYAVIMKKKNKTTTPLRFICLSKVVSRIHLFVPLIKGTLIRYTVVAPLRAHLDCTLGKTPCSFRVM